MSVRLQQFDHDKSPYERPTQKWVCGWAAEGEACYRGPDHHGRCHTTSECTPLRRGDRWHCTRAVSCGGECERGPMPDGTCSRSIPRCQPVRSLRAKRAMTVWGVSAATLGALLALALGPWNRGFLSPGPLSAAHGINDQECAACHAGAHRNQSLLGSSAVAGSSSPSDSERCLNCHRMLQFPDLAHNLPLASLRAVSAAAQDDHAKSHAPLRMWAARQLMGSDHVATQSLACATCHDEHRGRAADITFMNNTRCQTCHRQQFASFANGHREFGSDYPFRRRTGIAFNHVTHLRHYFVEDKYADTSPADCTACHISDVDGRRMRTLAFETSCASCHHHADEIHGAGLSEPSIAFLRLPSVALSTLEQHAAWIGDDPWPADAFDDENEMTTFMVLLLEIDPDVAADLNTLRASGASLADLSSADEQTVEVAARLVWAVKRLLYELIQGGQPALESRLTRALGDRVAARHLAALSGLAPDHTTPGVRARETEWQAKLRAAQELWLPNLMTDVERYVAGERSLRITDTPAEGDEPAAPPDGARGNDDEAPLDEDDLLDDEDLLLDDVLLDDQDVGDTQDEELLDDEELLEDELLDDEEPGDALPGPANEVLEAELTRMRSLLTEFASIGRWHLNENDFSIRYRPTGHADTFLRAWLDVTADARRSAVPRATQAVFDELRRETNERKAPGRCMKCHSVESVGGDLMQHVINWTANGGLSADRPLTTFTHAPHLNLAGLRDCTSCHTLNTDADDARQWRTMYSHTDPTRGRHSFDPITKSNCAQCHVPDQAGDYCLSCHNYHAGFAQPASVSTAR